MPMCHQTLVHAGKLLEDSFELKAYGLEAGCTLHQGSRLRGGKPVKVRPGCRLTQAASASHPSISSLKTR